MHWTTTTRTHRWSRSWRTLALSLPLPWARTLENRLPANRQSRTRAWGCAWRLRTRWCWRRSRVDRTRSRLRNNHAARRRSTLRCTSRPSRTVLCRSLRCRPLRGGSCYWRLRRLGVLLPRLQQCAAAIGVGGSTSAGGASCAGAFDAGRSGAATGFSTFDGGTATAAGGRCAATLAGVTNLGFGSGAGGSAAGAAGFVTTDFGGAAGGAVAAFAGSAGLAAGRGATGG